METIETLGKYEIKRPLGRGAMGIVYEGWDPIIARRVAIKTVRLPDHADPETEEALARFRREAQAAGRLTHPNIVAVFDYGETNDLAYIVMEFVDGPSLKMLLDKEERFALADTVRVMDDLLTGLQYSHERGVVHRDIKPANVMLTSAGQAKIADFGIARIESSSMTQAGTLLGTPAYMSPEQFMGQVVDARTDIYSSGVLLYLLLTGERPFEGSMSSIMHKALNTEPSAPSLLSVTAPPSFDAVVRRAMAKRPEDRFPSARAFAEAIRAAVEHKADLAVGEYEATIAALTAAKTSATRLPVASPTKRSSVPIIAVAALVALGVLGGGAWLLLALTRAVDRHDSDADTCSCRRGHAAPATHDARAGCVARPDCSVGEWQELRDPGWRCGRRWLGGAERSRRQSVGRGPAVGSHIVRAHRTDRMGCHRSGSGLLPGAERVAPNHASVRCIRWPAPRASDGEWRDTPGRSGSDPRAADDAGFSQLAARRLRGAQRSGAAPLSAARRAEKCHYR